MTKLSPSPAFYFPKRHLLTCEGLTAPEINSLLDLADKAAEINRQVDKKRDVVYLPGFWRFIMLIISHVPEGIFKRLKI